MPRRLALAIGVGEAKPLSYLTGAINGARAFHTWALKSGYESEVLIDEDAPVTMERLRLVLTKMLADGQPVHRLLLYFAGHGLIREAEEGLWLLSDWHKELRAVAVEVLKRRLSMYYDIRQIAIFADSCRSLPAGMDAADLTADGVIGRGPYQPQTPPAIDKFVAAQDGVATFMVPGASPDEDRCVFSGLLMEGLWGTKPDAFSKVQKDVITSRSLGNYLQSAVPALASRYGRRLVPNVSPTFPEGDDIYFTKDSPLVPPTFPAWPAAEAVIGTARPLEFLSQTESLTALQSRSPVESDLSERTLMEEIRLQPQSPWPVRIAGFAVRGGSVRGLWTPVGVFAECNEKGDLWRVGHELGLFLNHPVPVLIEFEDGIFAATAALPNFIATILRDHRGISALVYRPDGGADNTTMLAEKALAAMEHGTLRADALADLAIGLRRLKHYDPVLGVISAYLYDSIGDINNIRRMAYYYSSDGQPIPYDVALLGQLSGHWQNGRLWVQVPAVPKQEPRTDIEEHLEWTHTATPQSSGEVGGVWPWMRQGWSFLDDPADTGSVLIRPELIPLTRHLNRSRFATLDAEGGRSIATLFNLTNQNQR